MSAGHRDSGEYRRMARRAALPPKHLLRRAFSVGEGIELGLTRKMLAHQRYAAPFHGVRTIAPERSGPAAFAEHRVAALAAAYLPRVREGEAFSHTTALFIHGVPIRASEEIHVTVPRPAGPARGAGVVGHRSNAPHTNRLAHTGLPCVEPLTALMQAAPLLESRELVVAIDHLRAALSRDPEDSAALAARITSNTMRGSRRLRVALALSRNGAESRMESLVRLELEALGINSLELQATVCDEDGNWIGRFDLLDRERKRIIEFDGEQHRTHREQYLRDQRRLDRAWAAGYRVLRLTSQDLAQPRRAKTRERLCAFLDERPRPIAAELRDFLGGAAQERRS